MRSTLPLLVLAGALWGCAAPAATVASTAAPAAPPPAPIAPPPAPAEPMITTEDGLVRVPRPRGEGWVCRAERIQERRAPVIMSFVRCAKKTPSGSVVLMAKDYEVPPENALSAEELATREYPNHYKKRFDRVTYTRSGPSSHREHPAWDVEIEVAREGDPVLRIVERVAVEGTHTINVSATAPAAEFPAIEAEVQRWLEKADFRSLQAVRTGPGTA